MEIKNVTSFIADRHRFMLVVDSNERNLRFMAGLLKQFDYTAYTVKTVAEALELATVMSPVLIVAGRNLDGGNNALSLIRQFRSVNPDSKAPFIVLTTGNDAAFERDCLNAGALTCLHAPISLETFYRVIQVAIEPVPRMTIRISTDLPVTLDGARKDERVRDLSEQGAYIATGSPRPLRSVVKVRITLPDYEVSAEASVIYVRKPVKGQAGQPGMGLSFDRISAADQQRIRLFIRKIVMKGVADR